MGKVDIVCEHCRAVTPHKFMVESEPEYGVADKRRGDAMAAKHADDPEKADEVRKGVLSECKKGYLQTYACTVCKSERVYGFTEVTTQKARRACA